MSIKPWRRAQDIARELAGKLEAELEDLRGRFDRNELAAIDYTAGVAATVATFESLLDRALVDNQPPLTPKFNDARAAHHQVRVDCIDKVREAVRKFM